MALGLKLFGTGLFIGLKSGISSDLELLYGMPKIEHFNIGVEAFGERPIVICIIFGDHQFGPALQSFMEEMGPALTDLSAQVQDWSAYEEPEMLLNGDIVIRKKTATGAARTAHASGRSTRKRADRYLIIPARSRAVRI